jgi:signal transduction histidine kinase
MLFDFIAQHRDQLVARARDLVRARVAPRPTETELLHGVPLFLDQFTSRLRRTEDPDVGEISVTAALHGGELLNAGFTIGQVVHGYGDVCQSVMELAVELDVSITPANFKTLNMCLDIAIAEAVTAYSTRREQQIVDRDTEARGFLAHELRNLMNTATLAFEAVRSGSVGVGGSTGQLVATSLVRMSELVTESLAEVRLEGALQRNERIHVARLLEEIEIAAILQAKIREIGLTIEPIAADLEVDGDTAILASILTNLLQNACKFTHKHGRVIVSTKVTEDRVVIAVADACGGLPPGDPNGLFRPYEQRSRDRSGLGLGLAISRKGALALGGDLSVRDVPGTGCIFALTLRRSATA